MDSTAPLQVGVARLLGYRWPRQTGQTVSGAPPVPDDGLEKFVDEDGIVCIPSVRGEQPAADRLRELLLQRLRQGMESGQAGRIAGCRGFRRVARWRTGCATDSSSSTASSSITARSSGRFGMAGRTGSAPWSTTTSSTTSCWKSSPTPTSATGSRSSRTPWPTRKSGADDRLLKAQQLQDKLKLILEGEAPYDIFVRWKPLEQQPIGWHPDLNDGVRLNIRPFMEADVLRKRPNIKWGIDRGKNPPGSPWGEERDNDRHLTFGGKTEGAGK